jgi:dynein heavy chain 2
VDQLFARDTTNIDWEFIHGLFANAIYGGRVDDVHDIRILTSYLKDMFQPEVIATGKRSLGPLSLPGGSAGEFFQFTDFLFDNKLCKNVTVLC